MYLPNSPTYFPIERPLYELGPGLKNFGTDFGNGSLDKDVFQFTVDFQKFRDNKIAALNERKNKYICREDLSENAKMAVTEFILNRLQASPYFRKTGKNLECLLTNDNVDLNSKNLLEELLLQVPEDIAILEKQNKRDWISFLHLTSPSHWAAEDKIGLNFSEVHKPIPGIQNVRKAAPSLTDAMIQKGPFIRFVWSFVTDTRLNHHPVPPAGIDPIEWRGRSLDSKNPECFYLRVERQSTHGFPAFGASLFTIGLSFIPASKIKANPVWKSNLIGALNSMTPASREYKGVDRCFDELLHFLEEK